MKKFFKIIILTTVSFTFLLCMPLKAEQKEVKKNLFLCKKYKIHFYLKYSTPKKTKCSYILAWEQTQAFMSSNEKGKMNFSAVTPVNPLFKISLVTLNILNAADYVTTIKALKYPSLQEANPLSKAFVNNPYLYATAKFGVITLNNILLIKLHKKNKNLALATSAILNLVLSYVVFKNIEMIQKAQAIEGRI